MGNSVSVDVGVDKLGKLSFEEARLLFSKFDKNGDGVLSEEESISMLMSLLQQQDPDLKKPDARSQANDWFAKLDKNHDKCLSFEELTGLSYSSVSGGRQVMAFSSVEIFFFFFFLARFV